MGFSNRLLLNTGSAPGAPWREFLLRASASGELWTVLGIWILVMSAVSLFLFGADKRRAVKGLRRVPERTLLWSCALGGALGGLLAMKLFHHKTRKRAFSLGVPLLLLLQAALLAALRLAGYYL